MDYERNCGERTSRIECGAVKWATVPDNCTLVHGGHLTAKWLFKSSKLLSAFCLLSTVLGAGWFASSWAVPGTEWRWGIINLDEVGRWRSWLSHLSNTSSIHFIKVWVNGWRSSQKVLSSSLGRLIASSFVVFLFRIQRKVQVIIPTCH